MDKKEKQFIKEHFKNWWKHWKTERGIRSVPFHDLAKFKRMGGNIAERDNRYIITINGEQVAEALKRHSKRRINNDKANKSESAKDMQRVQSHNN